MRTAVRYVCYACAPCSSAYVGCDRGWLQFTPIHVCPHINGIHCLLAFSATCVDISSEDRAHLSHRREAAGLDTLLVTDRRSLQDSEPPR